MNFHYIFCEHCGKCCDINYDYDEGIEIYSCEDCGIVDGVSSEGYLCIGCDNFDETAPIFNKSRIDGCCDAYPRMPFKMFKRKNKCKNFNSMN